MTIPGDDCTSMSTAAKISGRRFPALLRVRDRPRHHHSQAQARRARSCDKEPRAPTIATRFDGRRLLRHLICCCCRRRRCSCCCCRCCRPAAAADAAASAAAKRDELARRIQISRVSSTDFFPTTQRSLKVISQHVVLIPAFHFFLHDVPPHPFICSPRCGR
jgi:hypothetical protein